nr:serine/threonine-protein kinase [Acanthopleuribacter pedis]
MVSPTDVTQITQAGLVAASGEGDVDTEPQVIEEETESPYKYELLKPLGKGGFAWVYLVRNLDLDRKEAIKILNVDLTEDADVVNRFVKEARIAAKFLHQNIVTIYEVHKRGNWNRIKAPEKIQNRHAEPFVYFTMSFVEGRSAADLVRKNRMPQRESLSIVMDACAALDYAHGRGVVHRDIKPDNILVDRRGRGIVMDFGIAKAADQTRQTAAGTFMGTARYVSPEQAMGREIDGRSDIYSLGITLYELVTGRVPFDSDQWMTVLYQHINEPPPPPDMFFEDIDRDLRAVILKMLEKKPENRFQTAAEVLDTLRSIHGKLGGVNRQTELMDNIATRQDLKQIEEPTVVTEIPSVAGSKPPVRTEQREAQQKVEGEERPPTGIEELKPNSLIKPLAIGGTLIALVVVLAILLWPKAGPAPDPVPVPLREGNLLVSAFPKGSIVKITDEQGREVNHDQRELPQMFRLPEGKYTFVINYGGLTQEISAYVSPEMSLSKAHAEFELELDSFLLEDLQ